MNKRFPMTIELQFEVPYWQNSSGMTDQELADYVVKHTELERKELVVEAKVILIHALSGEFADEIAPAGSEGLALEPGADACLALGPAPVRPEDNQKKVGWLARIRRGLSPRQRKES